MQRNMSEIHIHAQKRILRDFKEIQEAIDSDLEQLRGVSAAPVDESFY